MTKTVIVGCGSVGRRIARLCIENAQEVVAISQTESSQKQNAELGANAICMDFDQPLHQANKLFDSAQLYYLVPPQKQGVTDLRSQQFLSWLGNQLLPQKVVLISTTGVYGDCNGEWVTEKTSINPQTERGQRRADSEQQWHSWCESKKIPLTILRVPGIYSNDRLPRERLQRGVPVVDANECGYTNRIHAEDLARVSIVAMQQAKHGTIYNVTDGTPGKITEYLQAAAQALSLPQPPIISMQEAQQQLSSGMLSYLSESRRISNQRMLDELGVELLYPDFKQGLLA